MPGANPHTTDRSTMTNLPDFIFATGTRVLSASGAMTSVTFDNALDEA